MRAERSYWEDFYTSADSARVPDEPSAFARWVADVASPGPAVVDVGTGTARDALWFAARGEQVHGIDFARPAVEHARAAVAARGVPATFEVLDLYDAPAVQRAADRLVADGGQHHVYGRFLVHSLADNGRLNVWRFARTVLAAGGCLYLEFRTGKDESQPHVFGEHFRVFLSPDEVVTELETAGATVLHREEGHGLAVFGSEDPHVCRLVAAWTVGRR